MTAGFFVFPDCWDVSWNVSDCGPAIKLFFSKIFFLLVIEVKGSGKCVFKDGMILTWNFWMGL